MTGWLSVITDHQKQFITHTHSTEKDEGSITRAEPDVYLANGAGTHATRVEPGGLSYYSMKDPRYLVTHNSS